MLVLTGCLSPNPEPTDVPPSTPVNTQASPSPALPRTINRSIDLFQLRPELVNCQFYAATFQAPAEMVRERIPAEYEIDATGSAALATILVEAELCDSVVLNNETLFPNTGIFVVKSRVRVNDSLGAEADFHYYVLEIFSTNQTIVSLLQLLGFEARHGAVLIEEGPPISLRVDVEGETWYETSAVRWTPYDNSEEAHDIRFHQKTAEGIRWFDYNRTYVVPSEHGPTTIEARAGVIRALDPSGQGMIPAQSRLGSSHGVIAFGRL